MRILVVSNLFPPEFLGGYELGCAQMVEALRAKGHSVKVVTSMSARGDVGNDDQLARVLELPPIYDGSRVGAIHPAVLAHFHLVSSTVNAANVHALAGIIEEYEPDVAYLWNLLGIGGLGVLGLLRHLGVPWVWHIMDIVPRLLCGVGDDAMPQIAREFGAFAEGRYIVCSTHVAEEIRACNLDLGSEVHLLRNWVTVAPPARREEFFAGGELRMMCAVGLLGEHKGTDILIEVAARLHDLGYANFSLDIYGHERDPRFRRMLHEREVAETVRFMGSRSQPELLELYSAYDVFAFPTWAREPFGFAPLEAAACGCVPLFSADCGIAEWLVDDLHCLKADRGVEAFAQRIVQILRREVDIGAIGRRAQAVVCEDFHLDTVAPRTEKILGDAASEQLVAHGAASDFHKLVRFADGLLPALLAEAR
jgi:glycogen(starch) synthase